MKRVKKSRQLRGPSVRMRRVCSAVLSALLSVPALGGLARAQQRGMVESLTASEGPDGSTAVLIAVSTRPTFTTWKLEQPPRVVIDISGTKLGPVTVPFDAGTFAVGAVSAMTSDGDGGRRTRVVLTLRRAADYDVESSATRITVRVRPHEQPPAAVSRREITPSASEVERARVQAETRQAETERARSEARDLTGKLTEERRALEQERQKMARSEQATAEAARRLAVERAEAERMRVEADRARTAAAAAQKVAEQERAAAEAALGRAVTAQKDAQERLRQGQVEQGQKLESEMARARAETAAALGRAATAQKDAQERLRQGQVEQGQKLESEMARARAETARARQNAEGAAVEVARLAQERRALESLRAELSGSERTKLESEMARARAETARARQNAEGAAVEVARLAQERRALESLRAELSGRERTLSGAEAEVQRARRQTEELRQRVHEVKRQEDARVGAARAATERLQQQREQLDSKLAAQEDQRRRLAGAEKLVSERDAALKQAAVDLGHREQAVQTAAARLAGLARQATASQAAKDEASAALAAAEAERKTAAEATRRGRQELEQAVAARRQEDERRSVLERERRAEEQRLASAVARRASEEARLAEAAEARRQEEGRMAELSSTRDKLEGERARLEAERQALVSEVDRLRKSATLATSTALAKAPVPPRPIPAHAQLPEPRAARAVTGSAEAAAPRPISITLRAPSRVQRIDFVDEPGRSSVIIDLDEPSSFKVVPMGGRRVSLQLYKTELPRGLERSLDATEYLGPVKVISSYRDPAQRDAVRIDVEMAEDVPNAVRQDGARLYWDFRKSPSSARTDTGAESPETTWQATMSWPRKLAGYSNVALIPAMLAQTSPTSPPGASVRTTGSKKRYTGRRIDLDFKGADIHNILRLLADVGVVNIVTSDDVKGEVTIKMRDVPWDQALDVVLRQKQLGQVREGNLIRVAPLAVLEKELEQEIARQKQITEVLPTETRLIGVSYAEAAKLLERAKDLLSPRGKVSVDERTNTLILSDVARNLDLIEELIRNLDTQTSQVVIEARIVEARSTFVRQIGVQWGGTGFADTLHGNPTGLVFPHNVGIGGGATDGNTPLEGLVPGPRSGTGAANPNFAVNLPAAVGTGSGGALGLTMGSVAGAFNLNLRLSAMESSGQVRILSSPRISTLDNHEASIEQGVSIPISVVSAQGVQTVFVDAKLNLTVKPHVTNDGTVMMDITVMRNEPDFVNTGARGDPTILKKQATTMMLVRDGDTAVIGGIYQRNSGLNYAKVPFLADIPVLGALFRNRRENDDRTEFLVFITPRIANRARAVGQ